MKKTALLLALLLMLLPVVSCAEGGSADPAGPVLDARGKEVSFETTPSKIICLSPSDTENLYALGLADSIIGVSTYSDYPAEAKDKLQFGTSTDLSIEALIAAAPDVVIIDKMAQTVEQVEQIEAAGISCIVIESSTIEQSYSKIAMLGHAFNKKAEADKIVKDMKDAFKNISDKAAKQTQKTAYFEISPLAYGLWTCGKNTFQNELLEICNIKNVFDDIEGWKEASEEEVLARNPDVILSTTGSYSSDDGKAITEISARPNWGEVAAVKNGAIYDINSDITSRAGPRLVQAAEEIYKAVYGE